MVQQPGRHEVRQVGEGLVHRRVKDHGPFSGQHVQQPCLASQQKKGGEAFVAGEQVRQARAPGLQVCQGHKQQNEKKEEPRQGP